MPILVYVIAAIVLIGLGGAGGWKANDNHRDALELADKKAKDAALKAAAEEIARIDVKQVTIRQKGETIIRENTVYRECKHSSEMVETINKALKGG